MNPISCHWGKDSGFYDMIRIAVILLATMAVGSCSESSNGDTGCGSDCVTFQDHDPRVSLRTGSVFRVDHG